MVEVTCRTIEGRCLLVPTPGFTRRVNGVIGRALHLFPVALHGYNVMSNHLHFEASSPDAELLSRFESHVLGNTARVAKDLTGWNGHVWERCQPIPILDDLAAENRLEYILANGTKEGLVISPLDWPGPSSATALYYGQTLEAEYPLRREGRVVAVASYPIRLTPIPSWSGLSLDQRTARAREMVDRITAAARQDRKGLPPLGVEAILATDPFAPVALDRRPAPLCHATDDRVRRDFLAARRIFLDAHARASEKFRGARGENQFPPHAFLPPSFRA